MLVKFQLYFCQIGQAASKGNTSAGSNHEDATNSEALISLEFEIISPPSFPGHKLDKTADSDEMCILNLQFNSLDFIGERPSADLRFSVTGGRRNKQQPHSHIRSVVLMLFSL